METVAKKRSRGHPTYDLYITGVGNPSILDCFQLILFDYESVLFAFSSIVSIVLTNLSINP